MMIDQQQPVLASDASDMNIDTSVDNNSGMEPTAPVSSITEIAPAAESSSTPTSPPQSQSSPRRLLRRLSETSLRSHTTEIPFSHHSSRSNCLACQLKQERIKDLQNSNPYRLKRGLVGPPSLLSGGGALTSSALASSSMNALRPSQLPVWRHVGQATVSAGISTASNASKSDSELPVRRRLHQSHSNGSMADHPTITSRIDTGLVRSATGKLVLPPSSSLSGGSASSSARSSIVSLSGGQPSSPSSSSAPHNISPLTIGKSSRVSSVPGSPKQSHLKKVVSANGSSSSLPSSSKKSTPAVNGSEHATSVQRKKVTRFASPTPASGDSNTNNSATKASSSIPRAVVSVLKKPSKNSNSGNNDADEGNPDRIVLRGGSGGPAGTAGGNNDTERVEKEPGPMSVPSSPGSNGSTLVEGGSLSGRSRTASHETDGDGDADDEGGEDELDRRKAGLDAGRARTPIVKGIGAVSGRMDIVSDVEVDGRRVGGRKIPGVGKVLEEVEEEEEEEEDEGGVQKLKNLRKKLLTPVAEGEEEEEEEAENVVGGEEGELPVPEVSIVVSEATDDVEDVKVPNGEAEKQADGEETVEVQEEELKVENQDDDEKTINNSATVSDNNAANGTDEPTENSNSDEHLQLLDEFGNPIPTQTGQFSALDNADTASVISSTMDHDYDSDSHMSTFSSSTAPYANSRRHFRISPRRRKKVDMGDLTGLTTLITTRLSELVAAHTSLQTASSIGSAAPADDANGATPPGTPATPGTPLSVSRSAYISIAKEIVLLGRGINTAWRPVAKACNDRRLSERLLGSLSKCDTLASHMKVIVKIKSGGEDDRDKEGSVLTCAKNVVEAASTALKDLEAAQLRLFDEEANANANANANGTAVANGAPASVVGSPPSASGFSNMGRSSFIDYEERTSFERSSIEIEREPVAPVSIKRLSALEMGAEGALKAAIAAGVAATRTTSSGSGSSSGGN
ncbi:hypothetical protein HDU76_003878 [Blyttiomyces sp. JEL0837]|nr:hypothetical protein HDU76_003878 [Blyttiomyces sp. JEL0837]